MSGGLRGGFSLSGRVLYLTRDREDLRAQLRGDATVIGEAELLDSVSTDEMTPAWACFEYDQRLARFAYTGLRDGGLAEGAVLAGGFEVIVSGEAKGCGSSRETAPYAERACGVRVVVARSFAKIYRQNCTNLGLLTLTDFALLRRLTAGHLVPWEELTRELDPLSAEIVAAGGLLPWGSARRHAYGPRRDGGASERPRTMLEKIIAARGAAQPGAPHTEGEPAPHWLEPDLRFTHDYTTAMVRSQFEEAFGARAPLHDTETLLAFRDHLPLLPALLSRDPSAAMLLGRAERLAEEQRRFCHDYGVTLRGECDDGHPGGRERGICHNVVVEERAWPGQVIVGTDSHTCTAGALGCLAFGVGSTDMAYAWAHGAVRFPRARSVRLNLVGRLALGSSVKDAMLTFFGYPEVQAGKLRACVLEVGGEGLAQLGIDERATLANLAVEAGAITAIVEPDDITSAYLEAERGRRPRPSEYEAIRPDPGATYASQLELGLGEVRPLVALPGDPLAIVPLAELVARGDVRIDIAYAGSCTGSKCSDFDAYARVFQAAERRQLSVAPRVRCYVQFGSERVRRYAEARGYLRLFRAVGAEVLAPACGACIRAGPGASSRAGEITVSAANRNYPGRSGPGQVYLASPLVVAASAIAGKLSSPDELLE